MKSDIFISIIVPTFNRIRELECCLSSVINQTYSNWELIIVDDGSTDGSIAKIKSFEMSDSRIRLYQRPKQLQKGANTCRNIGINQAKGDYLAFLDSDDLWQPERLFKLTEFILITNAKAIYSGAKVVTRNGIQYRKSRSINTNESLFDFLLDYETYAQTSSMVVNKNVLDNLRFNESLQRHQDFDFFINVGDLTPWFFFDTDDVLVYSDQAQPKKIDFTSCVTFYKLHKYRSLDKEKRIGYLNYISESCAKINPNSEVLYFYKKEFLSEGISLTLRQKILFNFPYLFKSLFSIKRLMFQINDQFRKA